MQSPLIAALSLLLLLGFPAAGRAVDAEYRGPDGHWWLHQTVAARHRFVQGWTDGYMSGWLSAQARLIAVVAEAREAPPPDRKVEGALLLAVTVLQEVNPDYRKRPAHYADQVTTFFTTYADLRDCPVGLVLKGLDGRGPLTIEEIARWLRMTWAR